MSVDTATLAILAGLVTTLIVTLGAIMVAKIEKGNKQLRPNGGGSMFDIIMQMNTRLTRVEVQLTAVEAVNNEQLHNQNKIAAAMTRTETKVDTAATTAVATAAILATTTSNTASALASAVPALAPVIELTGTLGISNDEVTKRPSNSDRVPQGRRRNRGDVRRNPRAASGIQP